VEDYSITRNWIECRGQTAASSEALTHAAIYELAPNIGAIVHVHNRRMWEHYLGQLPTTNPNIPYGTPEMAAEMKRLWQTSDLESQRALVMAGHVDGMVTLGLDLQEATERMLQLHAELTHP
jgi:ribulose-5-phosphate 4-epimerase/fuculose-1-phosphate aldolase